MDRENANYERLAKIRPLLNMLRDQCIKLPSEQDQSIDEQMIKFKGRHSPKQYFPNKPTKRGFKVFSRNGRDGFMHDFHFYDGKAVSLSTSCGYEAGNVVIKLTDSLPKKVF